MTISKDRRGLYLTLSESERTAADRAFDVMNGSLRESGITTFGDDRAENLVGAIARFITECRS